MINFFRKTRKKLADNNQFLKYSRYAIGEIILVMVGILLALQINNWNEERKNKILEIQILNQLKTEYEDNLIQINQKIRLRELIISSCIRILSNKEKLGENSKNLDLELYNTIIRPTFDPSNGVINELINSGKLYLIRDIELKRLLSGWVGSVNELKEEEKVMFDFVTDYYYPFLIKYYQVGNISLSGSEKSELNDLTKLSNLEYKLDNLFTKGNSLELVANPDFEDCISHIIFQSKHTNDQSQEIKIYMEQIIDLINKELD